MVCQWWNDIQPIRIKKNISKMKNNRPYNRTSNEAGELIKLLSERIKTENPDMKEFDVTQLALRQLRENKKIR